MDQFLPQGLHILAGAPNPDYVERFEFFINGLEMANAYSELNSSIGQRERFVNQEKVFSTGDDEEEYTDENFLNTLEIGIPQ